MSSKTRVPFGFDWKSFAKTRKALAAHLQRELDRLKNNDALSDELRQEFIKEYEEMLTRNEEYIKEALENSTKRRE